MRVRSILVITEDAEPLEAVLIETRADNPFATVAAWIGLGVVVFAIVFWVWTRWIDPSAGGVISRYVNDGDGVLFEIPADQFRVTMPTRYERTEAQNEFGTVVTVTSSPGDGYQFTATKTPVSRDTAESFKTALNQTAGQMAGAENAEMFYQSQVLPFPDVALKDFAYRKDGTVWRVRLLLVTDRLYTLTVKAPNEDEGPYERMTSSFQILGAR